MNKSESQEAAVKIISSGLQSGAIKLYSSGFCASSSWDTLAEKAAKAGARYLITLIQEVGSAILDAE